jgi:DNA (cytosine-5)-methyltransferase 1
VEIKHNIPIDAVMVDDAYKKFKHTPIKRYYLLTTAEPYMRSEEEWNVKILLGRIRKDHGCEVIVNGLMQSIKYYLRLIRSPKLFLNVYTHALKVDAEKASEIKEEHLKKWSQILEAIK